MLYLQVLNYWRQNTVNPTMEALIDKVLEWQRENYVDCKVWETINEYAVIDTKQLKRLTTIPHTLSPQGTLIVLSNLWIMLYEYR